MTSPPVISYASPHCDFEARGRRLIFSYLAGLLSITLCLTALFVNMQMRGGSHPIAQLFLDSLLFLLAALLATSGLSFAIWLKHRSFREILYSHNVVTFFAGVTTEICSQFIHNNSEFLLSHLLLSFFTGLIICRKNNLDTAPLSQLREYFRRNLIVSALIVLFLLTLGYISAGISVVNCERVISRRITSRMAGQAINPRDSESARILTRVGVPVLPFFNDGKLEVPWARIAPQKIPSPFTVTIEWANLYGDLDGEGGETQFICIFGYTFSLGDRIRWVS